MIVAVEEMAGVAEAARLLGVSRQRIYQLTKTPDFPAGQKLDSGHVWLARDIRDWAKSKGREVHD